MTNNGNWPEGPRTTSSSGLETLTALGQNWQWLATCCTAGIESTVTPSDLPWTTGRGSSWASESLRLGPRRPWLRYAAPTRNPPAWPGPGQSSWRRRQPESPRYSGWGWARHVVQAQWLIWMTSSAAAKLLCQASCVLLRYCRQVPLIVIIASDSRPRDNSPMFTKELIFDFWASFLAGLTNEKVRKISFSHKGALVAVFARRFWIRNILNNVHKHEDEDQTINIRTVMRLRQQQQWIHTAEWNLWGGDGYDSKMGGYEFRARKPTSLRLYESHRQGQELRIRYLIPSYEIPAQKHWPKQLGRNLFSRTKFRLLMYFITSEGTAAPCQEQLRYLIPSYEIPAQKRRANQLGRNPFSLTKMRFFIYSTTAKWKSMNFYSSDSQNIFFFARNVGISN